MKRVLDMTPDEAKKYFLKSSSYFNMSLPEYYDFTDLLNDIEIKVNNVALSSLWNDKKMKIYKKGYTKRKSCVIIYK